jgi:hypothetical protein
MSFWVFCASIQSGFIFNNPLAFDESFAKLARYYYAVECSRPQDKKAPRFMRATEWAEEEKKATTDLQSNASSKN